MLALKVSAGRNGALVGLDDSSWPPRRWYLLAWTTFCLLRVDQSVDMELAMERRRKSANTTHSQSRKGIARAKVRLKRSAQPRWHM